VLRSYRFAKIERSKESVNNHVRSKSFHISSASLANKYLLIVIGLKFIDFSKDQ